jgi:hypothetical protein
LIEISHSTAVYGTPQRSTGLRRRFIVLDRFQAGAKDVFLNITGISVDDPAIDLAVVAAFIF